MSPFAQITAGWHEIGSDTIPGAGPKHRRRFTAPVWIDSIPLTWAHYEVFVAAGGYDRNDLWCDLETKVPGAIRPQSVDGRCRTLLEASRKFCESCRWVARLSRDRPLTGITWFEAVALCRFYGARLPFEAEWEVAMQTTNHVPKCSSDGPWQTLARSQCGCTILIGTIQEWTADAFLPRYFPSDTETRGVAWSSACESLDVTIRGASPQDLYQHASFRAGRGPNTNSPYCGFRRVWETPPQPSDVDATWRSRIGLLSKNSRT